MILIIFCKPPTHITCDYDIYYTYCYFYQILVLIYIVSYKEGPMKEIRNHGKTSMWTTP